MPGYALKELFHMIRSNFPQQRVFGLEVLAKIVEKVFIFSFMFQPNAIVYGIIAKFCIKYGRASPKILSL